MTKDISKCGYCQSKAVLTTYFDIRTGAVSYIIECPNCGQQSKPYKRKVATIRDWNFKFPTLF